MNFIFISTVQYLNTSHVKVKHECWFKINNIYPNLNTSHVKVKRIKSERIKV